jgi:hypothetical protein
LWSALLAPLGLPAAFVAATIAAIEHVTCPPVDCVPAVMRVADAMMYGDTLRAEDLRRLSRPTDAGGPHTGCEFRSLYRGQINNR